MRPAAHPTLADVAEEAGVGIATASRVVNGGLNVSAKTLVRVQAAVRRLGYLPNHAARILKGGRTKTIGLVVPSIADAFFASCAEAADAVARAHDSLLIFAVSKNDQELEMSTLAVLMRHRPDGLLLVPAGAGSMKLRRFVKQSTVPVVTFDRPLPGCPAVLTGNYQAAFDATQHLIGHGRKRILCFAGEPELFTISERIRGYRDAVTQAGLPMLIDASLGGDGDAAEPLLRAHLGRHRGRRKRLDAIFTLKNHATIATYQALQELKIDVPREVALVGFDDFDLACTLRPAVTVVQQPIEDVGRRAAELLFARLGQRAGEGLKPRGRLALVLQNRLVVRSSCGCNAAV